MAVEILPATGERFDDAEHALTGGGDGASCQCQWWMLTSTEFDRAGRARREEMLRTELSESDEPALIAYVDGEPAGWVRVGPRILQPRILRTRAVIAHSEEPLDAPDVWAVSCFVVRREHRGAGLNGKLLEAALAHARARGARVVEGYPVDASVGAPSSTRLWHGALSTFERAGFRVVARPRPDTALVSLALADNPGA